MFLRGSFIEKFVLNKKSSSVLKKLANSSFISEKTAKGFSYPVAIGKVELNPVVFLLTLPNGEMLFEIPGEENFEALPEQDNCPAFRVNGKFINSLAFNSIPQAGGLSSGSFANSVAGSFHAVFAEKPFKKIEKSTVSDQVLFSISSCSKESEKLFLKHQQSYMFNFLLFIYLSL